jgi:hypothetical protein
VLGIPFIGKKTGNYEKKIKGDMRAQKILLLIGFLLLAVLLGVYFIAVEGEQNSIPLTLDQKTGGPDQKVNK